MPKRASQLKKERPDLPENVFEIAEELDQKHSIAALANMEGGKVLLSTLLKDIATHVARLTSQYRTEEHVELVRTCAQLDSSLTMYRVLTRAGKQKAELEDILADALKE